MLQICHSGCPKYFGKVACLSGTWVIVMSAEAGLGLVKLVVTTNVFFNYHQHKIEIKQLICVK